MRIPMFIDEDAHYEYEREKFERDLPTYEDLADEIDREYGRYRFWESDDGYSDSRQ